MSCLRRIGIRQDSVFGEILAERITDAVSDENSVEESLAVVVMGRAPWRVELSVQGSQSPCAHFRLLTAISVWALSS